MSASEPRRSLEEGARVGAETYARSVKPQLRPEDDNKFVAFDIDTGEYEIDADDYTAVMRLKSRNPEAEIWIEKAGQPAAYKFRPRRIILGE